MEKMAAIDKLFVICCMIMIAFSVFLFVGGGILAGRILSLAAGGFGIVIGSFMIWALHEQNKTN